VVVVCTETLSGVGSSERGIGGSGDEGGDNADKGGDVGKEVGVTSELI
jgi:hypothetical protein